MRSFVCETSVEDLPYSRMEYTLLPLTDTRANFIQAAASFFVQSWMCASLPEIVDVWLHWDNASEDERDHYLSHLDHLFSGATLIDDPDGNNSPPNSHHTAPIGTFSETMLRWMRTNYGPTSLLVDPPAPMPTNDGKIDFVEITGLAGDFASLNVTLWEVKSSDSQAWYHNSKIYRQLEDYPKRFFSLANCLSASYSGNDIAFKTFLKQMGRMARNRHPQVHYGVFITYDPNVAQEREAVPGLHKHPANHPTPPDHLCHHLVLLLIPDFKVAGGQYCEGWRLLPTLHRGSRLQLRREPDNHRDPNAIEILTEGGVKIGYVPRYRNQEVGAQMDFRAVKAIVSAIHPSASDYEKVSVHCWHGELSSGDGR